MRFLTAAILFLVSAALLLTGIAERTIWHPPAEETRVVHLGGTAPLVVLDHSFLSLFPGDPKVTVYSDRVTFLAVARQADVRAWVGGTRHIAVAAAGAGKDSKVSAQLINGGQSSYTPNNADIWRNQYSAVGDLTAVVSADAAGALLVASNGFQKAPDRIRLSWPIVFDPTPSRILLISGAAFLLAALLVNWWAWYQMRKERGPRRRTPKAPQGPKLRRKRIRSAAPVKGRRSARNFAVAAGVGLTVVSLTGCAGIGAQSTPTGTVPAQSIQQPPVVTENQLRTIVERVAASVSIADSSHDPKQLEARVAGPALAARTAYYQLQKASKKVADLPAIATEKIKLALPAASREWPRTIMAVTSSGANDNLPQMLVLQQDTPRAQYKLWYDIDMLPKVQIPQVNTADVGAIPVAADSLFLKISPNALPSRFGDLLDLGAGSQSAMMFNVANDEYYQQIAASLQSQRQTLSNATIKVTHALGDPNVLSLATVNSGALVAVYMTDTYVIKPKDRTQAVAVSGNEKLLLGSAGSATGIKSVYGSMLLFYVPANSANTKDRIVTLGATQVLLKVSGL